MGRNSKIVMRNSGRFNTEIQVMIEKSRSKSYMGGKDDANERTDPNKKTGRKIETRVRNEITTSKRFRR